MGLGSRVDRLVEGKHPLLKSVSREASCWFLSSVVFCSQMSPGSRFLFIEFLNGLFSTGDFGIDSLNSSLRVWRSSFLSRPVTQRLGAGLPGEAGCWQQPDAAKPQRQRAAPVPRKESLSSFFVHEAGSKIRRYRAKPLIHCQL